jgi:hypothetical protein
MKIFVVHVNLGCCQNNSDGKMWVIAKNVDDAKAIIKQYTQYPITLIEEYSLNNELLFSTFHIENNYKLKSKTNNWGEWRKPMTP